MRIVRSASFAKVLLPILLAPFLAYAQEKSHATSAQVDNAIREVEKLAQKQIQEHGLPSVAVAIVFQDKVMYAKAFGVRDVNTKAPVDGGYGVSTRVTIQADWLDSGCRAGRRKKNYVGLKT